MTLSHLATPASRLIVVKLAYDHDALVWYVEHSDIAGLRAEAPTVEALISRLPGMLVDLIEDNEGGQGEFYVEVIASTSTRVRVPEAA